MSFSRLMRRLSSSLLGDLDEVHKAEDNSADSPDYYSRTSSLSRHPGQDSSARWARKNSPSFESSQGTIPQPDLTLIYCKNNVCIHPPTSVSTKIDHTPGYLSIKSHEDHFGGQTLLLSWIPNCQLKRGTSQVTDALHSGASPLFTPPPSSKSRLRSRTSSISSDLAFSEPPPTPSHSLFHRVSSEGSNLFESIRGLISGPPSRSSSRPESPLNGISDTQSQDVNRVVKKITRMDSNSSSEAGHPKDNAVHTEEFQSLLNDISNFCATGDANGSRTVGDTNGVIDQSNPPSGFNGTTSKISDVDQNTGNTNSSSATSSPQDASKFSSQFVYSEDRITFSSGLAEERSTRDNIVGVLTADLNQMRSIRMFFSDERETSGQLVVASCESQYKIFHFHNGGLDRLSSILRSYQNCSEKSQYREDAGYCFEFSVSSLTLPHSDCHRDEGKYGRLTRDMWLQYVSENGIIENDKALRKHVFFGGLDPSIRKEVWPFLLHYLSYKLTTAERAEICRVKAKQYHEIQRRRGTMSESEMEVFWRTIQTIVDKDVVRTDRNNPFFKGEANPNLALMRSILLNYAVYNPIIGYMQGMSDLLAPILVELKNEADSFWCFVGLMHGTIFISSPTDDDMELQLSLVRELCKIFTANFYQHLEYIGEDALELLFCHRWILLCFKREFYEQDALRIWESCWSRYETDYFHLFVCVAIIKIYGDDVYQKSLSTDEILLHFNTLAMHMSVDLVLKVARGLVYQFKCLTSVPCVLQTLYQNADLYTTSLPVNVYCVHNSSNSSKNNNSNINGSGNICPFERQKITSVKNYLKMQ